jgi:hypothetical protein
MADELTKLAEEGGITTQEAHEAFKRLRGLEKSAPSKGRLLRGAGVGAVAGPVAGALSDIIMGGSEGKGKGLAKALAVGGRKILARSATGAMYGGALPFARHKLERAAEMQKLREYVGEKKRGKLRGKIKKVTGL